MPASGRLRLFLSILALLAPGSLLVTPPAASAGAAATVVDLPTEVRAQPRMLWMRGRTDDGHLVIDREGDPTGPYAGSSTEVVVAPDGSAQPLDKTVEGVVGDRLVQSVGTAPTGVTSRLVSDTSWSTLSIPDGTTYLDYAPEGVLAVTGASGSRQLELLPWDGSATVPVDGLPADASVWRPTDRMGSGSVSLVWASSSSWSHNVLLLVDTAADQAWAVDPANPDCQISSGELWGVNDGTLVWQSRTRNAADQMQLCTLPVPAPGDTTVAEPAARPSVTLPIASAGYPDYDYRLLPVGDDVLVSSTYLGAESWGTDPGMPLVAVDPQGGTRTIRRWAYGVLPTTTGHVLAVTGEARGQESVQDIDAATGASTDLLAVDPIKAWFSGIAVDGDRVVYTDDSGLRGAVRERTVDFASSTPSGSTLVDTDATGPVAAGAGALAWSKTPWQDVSAGFRDPQGDVTFGRAGKVVQTDGRWVMDTNGNLTETATGAVRPPMSTYSRPVLQDGVTYGPGTAVPDGPQDSVIATDAATGQAAAIPVPPCSRVNGVQVAGSWMLVYCTDTAGKDATLVVDRTGATPTWRLNPGTRVYLGNGFVVARDSKGVLSWSPLAVSAPDWQTLGTAQVPDPPNVDWAVAVSRGDQPTVAWHDGRSAHAARLPVATSPLPAHPTGVVAPSKPVVHLAALDKTIRVYWDRAADAEQVTHYRVDASTKKMGAYYGSKTTSADGTKTSATLYPLDDNATYDVTVTAWNIAGTATSTTVSATPLPRPADPTGVTVHVDPVTSRATVGWDYTADPKADPVLGFSVWMAGGYGDALVRVDGSDARTASFVVDQPWQSALEVHADAAHQYGPSAATGTVSFPGLDTTKPKAGLRGAPKVVLTHRLTLRLTASDDRQLATHPVDVRWRTARLGHRLGSWAHPSAWRRIDPGTLRVRGLVDGQTACFSARSHDAAGNVSAWTAPRCTAVALDDRAMTGSTGTRRIAGARYFRGTATVLGGVRTSLRLPGLVRDTGWLVATTCPTCGRVMVLVGNGSYGSVNLHSATRHDRVLLPLPGPPQSGRLTLVPVRNKQRIVIDGVALLAH